MINSKFINLLSQFIHDIEKFIVINLSTWDPVTSFVFACQLRSIIWKQYKLFPINFIVFAAAVTLCSDLIRGRN